MDRGQSEEVGTVLLVATVVILVSVLGYFLLGTIAPDGGPTADIRASVSADAVTVTHHGGTAIPGDELTVVLRYDDTERRYDFAADGQYGPDAVFDPGETWRLDGPVPYDAGDRVELTVVHDPSETVLVRIQRVVTTDTPTPTPAPLASLRPVERGVPAPNRCSTNDVPSIDKPI